MIRKSILVMCTMALTAFAADVDYHGFIENKVGADIPVTAFDPTYFADNDVKLVGEVRLNDGVSISLTYRNYSSAGSDLIEMSSIDQMYGNAYGRQVNKNNIPLQVLAQWNFTKGGTLLLGDKSFSAGQANFHRANDTLKYGSIYREHSLRGFGVQAAGGTFFFGMVDSIESSMGVNFSYDMLIIDKPKTKLAVKPVFDWVIIGTGAETIGDSVSSVTSGRSREWNMGIEGSYSSYYNSIEYSVSGALGMMPYANENSYTFLVEPTMNIGKFTLGAGMYYASLADENVQAYTQTDIPEQWFTYIEPSYELHSKISIGLLYEYHDVSFNQDNDATHIVTPTAYIYPNDVMEIWASAGVSLNEAIDDGYYAATLKSVLRF